MIFFLCVFLFFVFIIFIIIILILFLESSRCIRDVSGLHVGQNHGVSGSKSMFCRMHPNPILTKSYELNLDPVSTQRQEIWFRI